MESTWLERRQQAGLVIVADMINHRGEVRFNFGKKRGDCVKSLVEGVEARPQGETAWLDMTAGLLRVVIQYTVKMFRFPPESHGQGFERTTATAALHGMPLDFAHDGYRDMRTLRKLALTPAKLADTGADSPSYRSPRAPDIAQKIM